MNNCLLTGFEFGLGGGSTLVWSDVGGGEWNPEEDLVGDVSWLLLAAERTLLEVLPLLLVMFDERCDQSLWLTLTSTPGEERRKEAAS